MLATIYDVTSESLVIRGIGSTNHCFLLSHGFRPNIKCICGWESGPSWKSQEDFEEHVDREVGGD